MQSFQENSEEVEKSLGGKPTDIKAGCVLFQFGLALIPKGKEGEGRTLIQLLALGRNYASHVVLST